MNACEKYEDMISAFIDGVLSGEDRQTLMAHMADCPACQTYFNEQIAIHDALMAAEEIEAPEGFTEDVMARARFTPQEKPRRKPVVRWQQLAALAACCTVVAAGSWMAFTNHSPDRAAVSEPAAGEDTTADLPPIARAMPEYDAGEAGEDIMPYQSSEPDPPAPEEGGTAALTGAAPAAEAAPQKETEQEFNDTAQENGMSMPEAPAGGSRTGTAEAADADGPQAQSAGRLYQRILITSSLAAEAWVTEQLGLMWTPGESYELSAEEYAWLREVLTAAEEAFEEQDAPEGDGFLLVAENSPETN